MKHTSGSIARALGVRLVGDGTHELQRVAAIESADESSLVFVESQRLLEAALSSGAGAVVAGEFASGTAARVPLLIAPQPKLAFARAARILQPKPRLTPDIHPNAVVDATVTLGADVRIEAHAVLGEAAVIGDRTRIGAGTFVGVGVRIGSDCDIGVNVCIYAGTSIGERVVVNAGAVLGSDGFGYVRDKATGRYEQFPQQGTLEIQDDVEIGANTCIDRGALDDTVVGDGVKLDNLIQVGHNSVIGAHTVIAGCTGISGSVTIGRDCMIGGAVGIVGHLSICDGVTLTGMTFVTKSITRPGTYSSGVPQMEHAEWMRTLAGLRKRTTTGDDRE